MSHEVSQFNSEQNSIALNNASITGGGKMKSELDIDQRLSRAWAYLMTRWQSDHVVGWTLKRLAGICQQCQQYEVYPW